jgi:lipid-A-disaccharide synthase
VKDIKANVDKMLVILPFEKDFYKKWDYEVEYVGHPLVQVIESFKNEQLQKGTSSISPDKPAIALLPGSRKQELIKKLPVMLEVSKYFPSYQFVVAKAPGIDDEFYNNFLRPYNNVSSVRNRTYELLAQSKAAICYFRNCNTRNSIIWRARSSLL